MNGFRLALKIFPTDFVKMRLTLKVDYFKERIQVDKYFLSKYIFGFHSAVIKLIFFNLSV